MARRWPARRSGRQDAARSAATPPPRPAPESVTAVTPDDYYRGVRACACHAAKPPPPLDGLGDAAMVAVAPVPGKALEEWRHVALGAWIARPDAAADGCAEVMTAGQLRALLAARDHG
ncbi:MAG TPA: hypothetical protein VFQ68_01440 [Streptosporangiaceae bacterium]|nr:hypothetical protein [Streptosporangiaceae bacterium]